MSMDEVWKDIPGFEWYYLASTDGRIFSTRSEKVLKTINRLGYRKVNLSVNGRRDEWPVHRLIAITFIPNPENKPTVNHINEDKSDNRVSNLEWATILEQNTHGTRIKRAKENTNYSKRKIDYAKVASNHDYKRIGQVCSKAVCQFDKDGLFKKTYSSLKEASESTGARLSHISSCIHGKRKTAGGWIWKSAD